MDSENMPNLNGVFKNTKGRQKIDIKRMRNESNLWVTFSKCRTRVFKKAIELATLYGVDLAVIMFSPTNHVFSFGNHNVDSVIQRYTMQGPPPLLTQDLNETYSNVDEVELHAHLLNCMSDKITIDKKCVDDLNFLLKAAKDQFRWAAPIESMNDAQLENNKKMLEESKKHLKEKLENLHR